MKSEQEHEDVTQAANEGEADEEIESFVTWQRIGRQALRVGPRTEHKPLRKILKECETLVIVESWLAHGENRTRTAEDLGVSRRVVRRALKAWHDAQKTGG